MVRKYYPPRWDYYADCEVCGAKDGASCIRMVQPEKKIPRKTPHRKRDFIPMHNRLGYRNQLAEVVVKVMAKENVTVPKLARLSNVSVSHTYKSLAKSRRSRGGGVTFDVATKYLEAMGYRMHVFASKKDGSWST